MNETAKKHLNAFFAAIAGWRQAYESVRLQAIGVRTSEGLCIVAARLYLDVARTDQLKGHFQCGAVEAVQVDLSQHAQTIEDVVEHLASRQGFNSDVCGLLRLPWDDQAGLFVPPPALLHPEGVSNGNRLAVLSLTGLNWAALLPQPDTDWQLRGSDTPYDSIHELAYDYGVGVLRGERCLIEVIARTTVEVLADSSVEGTTAKLGVLVAPGLDRSLVKLGYRVLNKGEVAERGSVAGADLDWTEGQRLQTGTTEMTVPDGAAVQCIASYRDQAHHIQWRADPSRFQNPRAAVLSLVDPSFALLRGYLKQDSTARGRAADDFESAIAWTLWALGFSVAAFGTHPKTRDAFDLVGVAPSGDYLVIECTLGLLRSEGKLSRLGARVARIRQTLDENNLRHLRVLPVIVTAMTEEQVKADVPQAEELGVLVLTQEGLDDVTNELLKLPNADALFNRGFTAMRDRQLARANSSRGAH